MAELKINLLKSRRAISEKDYLRERRLFIWSLTGFLGLFVVMSVLFGFNMWYVWQTRKVKSEVKRLEGKMAGLQKVTQNQLYLRSRLDLIEDFLKSRVRSRESLERVFSLDVGEVIVTSAFFDEDEVLKVQLEAGSVVALRRVLDWFRSDEFFLEVVSRGLSRLDQGGYSLQLELLVPKQEDIGGVDG